MRPPACASAADPCGRFRPPAGAGGRRRRRLTRVLVVDDDPQIVRAVRLNLSARGYTVSTASTGRKAVAEAAEVRPDVVVLDLGLPDLDGVAVIAALRRWTSVPIVVLSGRAGSSDKVEALEAGADDYVTKPFDIDELVARLRAVTRRATRPAAAGPIRLGHCVVDLENRLVTRVDESAAARAETHTAPGEQEVHLTPTQWQLLEVLLRNPDRLISQRQLLTEVWGPRYETETHYVRQYMAQLRYKLVA